MKAQIAFWTTALLVCSIARGIGATLYVSLTGANPVPPYGTWNTAATNIQDAIDAAANGDSILVTNGVYEMGGRTVNGYTLTNRVVIDKAVTVQSVNGPAVTAIDGYQIPGSANGLSAVRGVYLGDGAQLIGFTITGGATTEYYDNYYDEIDAEGGGIWCQSTNVLVSDCIVESNSCTFAGAGIYSGTAIGCQIVDNANRSSGSFSGGGGAAFSVLLDDQVNSNSIGGDGFGGAGAFSCILSNCVIDGNSNGAVLSCSLENCTIEGNTHSFYAGGASLSTLSNCFICYNQGSEGGGAYDCTLNSCVISNNLASLEGGGVYYDSHQTNAPGVQNIIIGNVATNGGGVYFIGIITNLNNWTFISNSAAGSGGGLFLASDATLENCAFTGNSCGVNGGGVCGSQSYPLASVSNCVFIANIASWFGGGAYETALTDCYVVGNRATNGGGVYGIVNNCVLNDNSAAADGGGLFYYTESVAVQEVSNCAFTNNSALNGGGAYAANYYPFFSNCVFQANSAINDGGGIDGATLGYCVLSGNTANDGGGGSDVSLFNCLLDGNSAIYGGGAFYNGAYLAEGSTIVGNNAQNAGGGLYSTGSIGMTNCIIYDNSAPNEANYTLGFYLANFCCSEPLLVAPFGQPNSNITNAPSFVNAAAGDYHLSSKSPLINSGNNASIAGAVDLDGNPRIVGGTVDIGAYEYQTPVSKISYAWLDQYGLPIIAGIDTSNLDGTGLDIYQDWIAGLNPTNVLSILAMLPLAPTNNAGGLVVSWKSVAGRTYFVQCSTNLAAQPAFSTIETGINGSRTGTTSFTDTSATNPGQYFFRVGVEK